MPDTVRSNDADFGIAKQTDETTAAANPTITAPINSGLVKPVRDEAEIETSDTGDQVAGIYTREQHGESEAEWFCSPGLVGYPLLSMLPALTSSAPTHTFTKGTANPAFFTLFSRHPQAPGGTAYRKLASASCKKLTFAFEHGEIVKVQTSWVGYTPTHVASPAWTAPTGASLETFASSGSTYLVYNSGTLLEFDLASATPTTAVHTVQSGEITFEREIELIQTDSLEPEYRNLGRFRIGISLETLWDSDDAYRQTFYGSTTGTASSLLMPFGSFQILFPSAPTSSATVSLDITCPNIRWRVPEPADADAGGGPATYTLTGTGVKTTTPVTAILKNGITAYTS